MTALIVVMPGVFVMGFILDFIKITFIVIPLVGPTLLAMGFDPVWLGLVFALNLQTSFLTPPFGFSLFYLRGWLLRVWRLQISIGGCCRLLGFRY